VNNIAELKERLNKLPGKYTRPDGEVEWELVYQDLGILSEERLKDVLLMLLRTDTAVSYYVHRNMLRLLCQKFLGEEEIILDPPPSSRYAWLMADKACLSCPENELVEIFPGFRVRKCGCEDRIDCWERCENYRTNLFNASKEAVKDIDAVIKDVEEELKEVADGMFNLFNRDDGSLAADTDVTGVGVEGGKEVDGGGDTVVGGRELPDTEVTA
jgi:hypothetical protein